MHGACVTGCDWHAAHQNILKSQRTTQAAACRHGLTERHHTGDPIVVRQRCDRLTVPELHQATARPAALRLSRARARLTGASLRLRRAALCTASYSELPKQTTDCALAVAEVGSRRQNMQAPLDTLDDNRPAGSNPRQTLFANLFLGPASNPGAGPSLSTHRRSYTWAHRWCQLGVGTRVTICQVVHPESCSRTMHIRAHRGAAQVGVGARVRVGVQRGRRDSAADRVRRVRVAVQQRVQLALC